MKLFYFLDFLHIKKHATPITYDRYAKLNYGPIPSMIKNMIDDLELDMDTSDLADTISVVQQPGQIIHRIMPKRRLTEAEKKFFSEDELEILNEVCRRFGAMNKKDIEDASHKEAPWRLTSMFQEVPYILATKDDDCQVSAEEINLALRLVGI